MDILLASVICLVAKLGLMKLKYKKPRRKKRQPIGALLFGGWYYWYLVNYATANHK